MGETSAVFECKKCGHCCEGRGGIVLSPKDLARLAAHLDLDPRETAERYAEISNAKLKIRNGDDGFCIFFRRGAGCIVHEAKPDICRAWPFFRGNMEDAVSLDMARAFCPGIGNVSFEEFASAGLEYLRENGLMAKNAAIEANSLVIPQGINGMKSQNL